MTEFKRTVQLLERAEMDIRALVASGGTAEIYFFLPGQVTHGITIDQPTVAYMADLGLKLSFEVVVPSKYAGESEGITP